VLNHSRSFSLSLLSLHKKQRAFVALTYLVARVADTIADSGNWPSDKRLTYLALWENAVIRGNTEKWRPNFSVGSFSQREMQLLLQSSQLAEAYLSFSKAELDLGRECLEILIQAMCWFVQNFAQASIENPVYAIPDLEHFDWYCYSHAGCVGIFWVKVFGLPAHLEPLAIDYGKALERINVLRDVVEDREQGRILLPKTEIEAAGFQSTEPWKEEKLWSQYCRQYIEKTKIYLLHAAQFCDSIDYPQFRLRWASMMPLKIGVESLKLYEKESRKESTTKIGRRLVKALAFDSSLDVLLKRKLHKRLFQYKNSRMKIYTKTGDAGSSSLYSGKRVPKNSSYLEAYGNVDELSCFIGRARAVCDDQEVKNMLMQIQNDLHFVAADLATPLDVKTKVSRIEKDRTATLEKWIDQIQSELEPLRQFILPGGSSLSADLHICRSICRRAERAYSTHTQTEKTNPELGIYLNRLSDLLFVMARWANKKASINDIVWDQAK